MINKINLVYEYETPVGVLFPSISKKELPSLFLKILDGEVDDISKYIVRVNHNNYTGIEVIYSKLMDKIQAYCNKYKHNKNEVIIDFVHVDDIEDKDGEVNIILIESSMFMTLPKEMSHLLFYENILSNNLIKKLKDNKTVYMWLIDDKEASYDISFEFKNEMKNFLIKHKIKNNKILFSNCNNFIEKYNKGINYFPINSYVFEGSQEEDSDVFGNKRDSVKTDDITDKIRDRVFLNYNRNTSRLHRLLLVSRLKKDNVLDNCIYSFYENPYFDNPDFVNHIAEYEGFDFTEDEQLLMKSFIDTNYPIHLDFDNQQTAAQSHNYLSDKYHYLNTYFSIVTETSISSRYCFVTEKCIRPMLGLHPFILFGNPHILKVLKESGFKTFDKWIDESYDLEMNTRKRFEMAYEQVLKINNMPKEEIHKMYKEMIPTLEYNRNLVLHFFNDDGYVRNVIESLEENINKQINQLL